MSYMNLVLYLGPKLMRNRSPFDLSRIIMVYNAFQIVHNVWMFNEVRPSKPDGGEVITSYVNQSIIHLALRLSGILMLKWNVFLPQMANVIWHYYMSKIIDLLDTIFFMLRKKNNQITLLHVFHHAGMPAVAFICVRYYAGGHCTLTAVLNTLIHSIMYFYYFVAALGPSFKKHLWWKKYLTVMQMVNPRTIDWFLVRNPIYLLIILMTYLYFIQYLGPKLMKDRNPFDLSRLIMIFNVTQIVYNVWMFNEVVSILYLFCQKFYQVCLQVFFVLRKKNNQITPLHLVHHFGMPFLGFVCVRFFPGGHVTLTGLLNTFIHSVMYFYYFVAGLGPRFKKYLWWKQYLTLLQMIQFLIISIHSSIIVLSDCDFAKRQMFFLMVNTLFMFSLFSSFYRQTYMKKTS
uniref:Elongation of very long chain fatty acids protein n=1 Tax=Timema genevievae TaxID=629358 RepID=A0A7R9PJQ9_TIMGE|nr:unnamed protein product [Timema genevievae]